MIEPLQIVEKTEPWRWDWVVDRLCQDRTLCTRLGLSIEWEDSRTPVLRASDKVGHIQFSDPEGERRLNIAITPKVVGSVSGMLRAALSTKPKQAGVTESRVAQDTDHPSAWLASVYVHELERFLTLIRPRGEEIEEELSGRLRGRPLVDEYLKHNYVSRRHVVPCRYVEWTMDNLPNRILRYAAFRSRQVLSQIPVPLAAELGMLRRCDAALAAVELVRVRQGDLERVRSLLRGSFRRYRDIVHLARLIISVIDPFAFEAEDLEDLPLVSAFNRGTSEDGVVTWDLVDMPDLFEEYVRLITRGQTKTRTHFPIQARGTGPHMPTTLNLDRAPIQAGGGKLVIDAKYKLVGQGQVSSPCFDHGSSTVYLSEYQGYDVARRVEAGPGEQEPTQDRYGRVSNADLYQVIAYATHEEIRASTAALVYPATGPEIGSGFPHYTGLGHCRCMLESGQGIPIYVLSARIDEAGIRDEIAGKGALQAIRVILNPSHSADKD